jgi:glycosyltransferase involved in cell wall biosynthesis
MIKKIVWLTPLFLDIQLHRTTQLEIIKNLAKKGNDIILIGMRSKNSFRLPHNDDERSNLPRLRLVPIRYFPVVAPVIYAFVAAFILPLIILSFEPDFVIIDPDISVISSIPGIIISKLRKTKFVLDIRSVPVELQSYRGLLRNFWFNISVLIAKSLFSGITTITPMMKEDVCTDFSLKPSKIGVWTSGVSAKLFDPDVCNIQSNNMRNKFGLSEKFIVFYHGNLSSSRGLLETCEAMIKLKKYPKIVLYLLGSGPFALSLKSFIKREKLQDNIIIHDPVEYEQVPNFICMSDVCIIPLPDHPDWRSQSPLKLFEYLSMEKVVIATDIPAHRSVLENQKCGIYLSSVKPEEIAKIIEYASDNKEQLSSWGKQGRKIILQKYTWDKVAGVFEDYLNSIDPKNS